MSEENELPEGWVETTLGDILPIQYGKGLVDADRDANGHIPVYGSSGIVGFHNQALTAHATLVIGRKGSIGSIYYSPIPCWPIDTTYFVEENENLNLKFFLYLLSSLGLIQLDKSVAIPGLNRDDYNAKVVKIPPFLEQQRIVESIEEQFSLLDDSVTSLQKDLIRLKRAREAVLKFAVEGKITEEWREENSVTETGSELLARILAERRARWEAEELAKMSAKGIVPKDDKWKEKYKEPIAPDAKKLPELPENWCWATVDQIGEIGTGATPLKSRTDYYLRGTVPWITSGALNSDIINNAQEYITEKALEETNAKLFPAGTLLVAMYGEGKTRGKVSELKIIAATN